MSRKNKQNMGSNNNFTAGNDINQKFNKSNQNQVDKSTNIYQIIHEVKPMNSLDNMSDRDGLEVKYKYIDNVRKVDDEAIIHVQAYAVKFSSDKLYVSEYTNKKCVRVLIINIHQQVPYGWQYKCDHVHLYVPEDLINESLEGRLINIKGFVYPYNDDTKRSIEAIDIKIVRDEFDKVDEPQRIRQNRNFNYEINKLDNNYKDYIIDKFKKRYCLLTSVERIKMLEEVLYLLELCLDGNFYDEFISNYIVTQYTCNFSPRLVRELSYDVLLSHEVSSANVTIIACALIHDIISKEITTLPQLFEKITGYVNWALGLNDRNIRKDMTKARMKNDIDLSLFKERVNYISDTLNVLSAYRFALLKIENFGKVFADERDIIAKAADVIFSPDYKSIIQNKYGHNNNI